MEFIKSESKLKSKESLMKNFKDFFKDTRILALDQDENSLIIYKKLFLNADIFNNSIEALSVAKIQKYDIFMLELRQYNRSGIDIKNEFNSLELNTKTPVLLVTADILEKQEIYSQFDDVLFKPFELLSLYFKVGSNIDMYKFLRR